MAGMQHKKTLKDGSNATSKTITRWQECYIKNHNQMAGMLHKKP